MFNEASKGPERTHEYPPAMFDFENKDLVAEKATLMALKEALGA